MFVNKTMLCLGIGLAIAFSVVPPTAAAGTTGTMESGPCVRIDLSEPHVGIYDGCDGTVDIGGVSTRTGQAGVP